MKSGDYKSHVVVMMESQALSGPARNLLETLLLLRDRIRFSIVTFVRSHRSNAFVDEARKLGFEVHILEERFRYDPAALIQLRNLLDHLRPDVLQVHNTKSRFYIDLLSRFKPSVRRIPRVDFFHGETWVDTKQKLYNRLDRWLFTRSPNLIAVSNSQKRLLGKWGVNPERVTVIHNAVPIREMPRAARSPVQEILYVGRLSKEKGHMILMEAVGRLVERGRTGFRVVLVGDGPEFDTVQRFIRTHKLEAHVLLCGYQAETERYYAQADLFVLPSLTEGLPNVLLEAALYRVPILAFDVGGIPEMFENEKEAVLVSDHSAPALAEALQRFLDRPEFFKELAERARQRIEKDFNIETKAEHLFKYYRDLIAR